MPPKRIIRYRSQIDYDKTYAKAIELEYVPIRTGGRHSAGESPEAQITLDFQRFGLDCKANIYHNGKIQISYLSKPHLHKTVRLLKRCLVPCTGKKIKLEEEKYDFDPLDRSVQHTVTENWQYSGARFFQAKVLLYIWLDTKKDEYIYRTPNKEGLVNIPGTQYHVKPERLR
jgi:hypothetical protein